MPPCQVAGWLAEQSDPLLSQSMQRHLSTSTRLCMLRQLSSVMPAELVERVGGLEAEAEWSHVLSLGEQQRVAFLRLLLHSPKLAFLDEATGALDSATEAALYTALQRYCTSYVSVGEAVVRQPAPSLPSRNSCVDPVAAAVHCCPFRHARVCNILSSTRPILCLHRTLSDALLSLLF